MMPGAANGAIDHQSVGERPMIVTAMSADGENVRPVAHQQNLVIADMTDQLVILERAGIDTLRQIGSVRLRLLLSHLSILWDCTRSDRRAAPARVRQPTHPDKIEWEGKGSADVRYMNRRQA
jgi:hypothetical protein